MSKAPRSDGCHNFMGLVVALAAAGEADEEGEEGITVHFIH